MAESERVAGTASPGRPDARGAANRRLAVRLGLVALLATGFGFALVPLYDVLCRVTGLNGKTTATAQPAVAFAVDTSRQINIEFMATAMPGAAVAFAPTANAMRVHPGEVSLATYRVKNLTNAELHVQAVPSVSPGQGAQYFNKIDCFCFKQQTLAPGEEREMPLTFVVSPELPSKLATLTLSYAMFPLGAALGEAAPITPEAVRKGGGA